MPGSNTAFTKMHGAGNDFVVLDLRDGRHAPDAALCAVVMFLPAPRWWMAAIGTTIMGIVAIWLWRRPEPRQ